MLRARVASRIRMPEPSDSSRVERILDLDPRALLRRRDTGEQLRAWLPPEPHEIAALFPGFEILEIVGRGGMGAVYKARQPALDRFVAIKLLPPDAAADHGFAQRFRNEARILARLQHPNIIAIHETGQTTGAHLYIVMEYVKGCDLSEVLARGPLLPGRAIEIARAICDALEVTHQQGVVHRDIKPANVLIAEDGAVKVVDFGVARLRTAADETQLTYTGLAVGTPDYMAPEQRLGGTVDGRADLFSLGVLLYEMLTGEVPRGAWQPPSQKAPTCGHLDSVLQKAMQADPARRQRNAAELRAGLENNPRPAPRVNWVAVGLFALIVAGSLVAALLWWAGDESGVRPSPLGDHAPLAEVQLHRDIIEGHWRWSDNVIGGTLAVDYAEPPSDKILRLPVQPGDHPFEIRCEIWLEHQGGSLTLLFPAGSAQTGLTLDLYDTSGLELVRGLDWRKNETTVKRKLPYQRFLPLKLRVQPDPHRVRVSVTVTLEGEPFLSWEGDQRDLSRPFYFANRDQIAADPLAIFVTSASGGARLREFSVNILPHGSSDIGPR